jgi:hypothetical protein
VPAPLFHLDKSPPRNKKKLLDTAPTRRHFLLLGMTNASLIFCTANQSVLSWTLKFQHVHIVSLRRRRREWRYLPANKTNNGAGAINSRNKKQVSRAAAINISRLINSHGCLTLQSRDYAILHRKRPLECGDGRPSGRWYRSGAEGGRFMHRAPRCRRSDGSRERESEKETLTGTFALCRPVT